ncbi:MAG TPA: LysR family transcriptional regulator, partial [Blastocatellia bacterium]|nr:LysR family transcriptional regulator [Blastocatellia bacterium]
VMNYIDLNLRQLQTFVTVARVGSFTRAAHLLHLSQPALTKQIRQLEETLSVRLFDRNTRTVEVTRIGKELAPVVEQLMREIDAVVVNTKKLAERSRGAVRVAALPSICSTVLPEAIARFKKSYPGISVILKDILAEHLVAMVKSQEVDFGIGSLNAADSEVQFTLLLKDRIVVVFPPGFELERKQVVELKDLAGLPLILMDKESSVRRLVDRAFESIGRFATPAFEATFMSTAAGMVKAGLGVALLPSSSFETGQLTGLRSRPIKHPALTREIGVIQKAGRSLSPAAETFLKSLRTTSKKGSVKSKTTVQVV